MKINLNVKQDFEELMLRILNPLKPYYSNEKAGLTIGHTSAHYENRTVPMEGFSRPLWALAPYWADKGTDEAFSTMYQKGLVSGTDPNSPEYWGTLRDYDQRLVEMAAIAYGILLAPDVTWNPLSQQEKENLAGWLNQMNTYECHDCNWQYFCILVNMALKKRGMPYSKERLENSLKKIESYYQADGWYRDGDKGQKDYYVSFAMHFYGIVYAFFMKDEDPNRCALFTERAITFGKEFVYWFAENGSALPFGRSLTYRFAQVAFFSACVAFEIPAFPLPVMKGIITRHLSYWMERPIFDNDDIMTIGYEYPNLSMSESYNSPGSPYWAMKSFAFLLLPAEHEFYKVNPEALPALNPIQKIACGDMIMVRNGGEVTAFTPGMMTPHMHTHTEEKYCKFAYSTKYGFSISRSQKTLGDAAPDSVLSFELFGHIFVKTSTDSYETTDNTIKMVWSPIKGIRVNTVIDIKQDSHTRTHEIISDYDCMAYDAGFAVSVDDYGEPEREVGKDSASVKNKDNFCKVLKKEGIGCAQILVASANTNLIHPKTAIPMIAYEIKKGRNFIVTEIM